MRSSIWFQARQWSRLEELSRSRSAAGSPSNKTVPHQVAVCKLGIGPDDVVIANPNSIPINDPNCPVVGPSPPSPLAVVQKQFTEPGRYLVLCNLGPHFTEFKMYGWVNVH